METLKKKITYCWSQVYKWTGFLDSLQVPVCSVISGYTRVLGIAKHQ
jgi:hypothetical protein